MKMDFLLKTSFLLTMFVMTFGDSVGESHGVEPFNLNISDGCYVSQWAILTDCYDTSGNKVDMSEAEEISSGTSCLFVHGEDQVFQVLCLDGVYVLSLPEEKAMVGINRSYGISKHHRTRRFVVQDIALSFGLLSITACFIFCDNDHATSNTSPSISTRAVLKTLSPVFAEEGATSAKVSWELPTITDAEDESIKVVASPTEYKSGRKFHEGSYVIYFVGTDSGGLSVYDFLTFEVKVHRCEYKRWPENGYIECERNDIIFGTKCKIRCKSGYSLEKGETNAITCDKNGGWTPSNLPDCKAKQCKPPPRILNGKVQCFNHKYEYGSICAAVCDQGFQIRGMRIMGCDKNGKWDSKPVCEDFLPPSFFFCPSDMLAYIDAPNNTAVVKWIQPEGTDNSKEVPKVTEVHGYKPGQRFKAGSHSLHYRIEDKRQNKGQPCNFRLKVITLSCSPPNFDKHLKYDCPDTYRLGAECSLTCKSGYPKAGADKIVCVRNTTSYPPKLEWKWEVGGLAPFCRETNCSREALKEPLNGALACSQRMHGQMCQMQCNAQYDIPNINNGLFVCGRSTGEWRPSSYVPDCNQKFDVNSVRLPSEFYYFTGECSSSTETLNEIQENFVKMLNTSDFLEICVGVPECQAKYVDVKCEPILSRRKRDSFSFRKRHAFSKPAYVVYFYLYLSYIQKTGKRPDEIFAEHKEILYKMSDKIQAEADSGHFDIDVGDLYVDKDSFGLGVPSLECPTGMIPRIKTATCAGCPVGHYATENGRCTECPFGTYQNSSNSVTCEPCPPNTNTTETRSENITQCLDYCEAGEFSPTKLEPCTECPGNSYQPNPKSISCIRCGSNKRTSGNGATSVSQCQVYDVQVVTDGTKLENKDTHDVITVFMWLYISNASTFSSMEVKSPSSNSGLSLIFTPTLVIGQYGDTFTPEEDFPTAIWTNIALSIDKSLNELKLYINGKVIYENSTFLPTNSHVLKKNDLIEFYGDITISAFNILPRKASLSEILKWSSTCSPDIIGTILSMDDIAEAENVTIVVPSVCDAVNECTSSPCGTHTCINKLGDYECACTGGFTGKQCQTPPDFCQHNECKNVAVCVNETANYTCECAYGFSGVVCEIEAVDGQWSEWSNWALCSKSCGSGVATRERRCDSPPPDPEGNNCTGNSSDVKSCDEVKCPECLKLRRTYGLTISCNEKSAKRSCTIACKSGLYFTSPHLSHYECGVATGYKWNHQNENNTKARLPSCSEIQPPRDISAEFEGVYESIPCTTKNRQFVKASLERKLATLDCMKASSCQTTVKEPACMNASWKKRSTGGSMTVTIGLASRANTTTGYFDDAAPLENTTDTTQELIEFVKLTLELEKSAQKLLNDSVDFFEVTVDGANFTLAGGSSALTHNPTTICPSGFVRIDVFCAESPVGSYSDGKIVQMCPAGQYQDEKGQTDCKQCPQGKTTDGIGSINVSECSEEIQKDRDNNDSSSGSDGGILIGVYVSVSVVILVGVAVAIVCKTVWKKRQGNNDSNTNQNDVNLLHMSG